ncbi:centriolar coiled-coil protein of 110 kDa-like isoform X2 [Megalobrama amblycephala]|uniref:centriolar coiled-coil protein of 110 kDa-like isoform X2 n=1 Tax=Megalobrama amblycephala TaxID=75352 RepID=UPI0020141B3F|nr:centriolar coiled-coil protein of 110 kDa-like isoform X2 [Megalobrama amblycephala]
MDSYEGFCARILSTLQSEMMHEKSCSTAPARGVALPLICFHGRPVLSPILSEKQRREMVEYRKRASQMEAERHIHCNNNLLNQIQAIIWTNKAPKILDAPKPSEKCLSPSPKPDCRNGFTDTAPRTPAGVTEPYILSSKPAVTPSAELRGKATEEKQMPEETETEGVCLQNLLKKSREFIEKEQGSKIIGTKITFDKENISSLDATVSGLPCYIPSPNQTSPSNLISPESGPNGSLSARPHRGRPRPISAGSIFFSFPDNPNHPNITANARPQEVKTIATQERKLLGVENVSMSRYDDHLNETVGKLETSPVDSELTSPLFRRRCHTLDSHLSSHHQSPLIDRSQERMPRFMAGVTARTPTRLSPPSPMNKTFTRESPTAAFMGPGITPDSPSHAKLPFEGNSVISTALKERRADEMQWQVHALEDMQRSLEEDYAFRISCLVAEQEREQRLHTQELEERVWRLRGQGGLSPVAGEDGCELRAAGERYPILNPMCPLSPGERSPRHPVPVIEEIKSYLEQHDEMMSFWGFPPTSLDVASPSIQASIYMRGLNHHSTGKSRNRLSQVVTAEQQRALCRLTAIVKGFLTRQLLRTEKVKHLRQTVQVRMHNIVFIYMLIKALLFDHLSTCVSLQDTQEFICSFSTNAPQRNDTLSEQDLSLQERVRAQLRAALFDIHDIFFTMTLEERLSLLHQDRDLRSERKLREMEKAKIPKDKVILSAATQKSLDRKKRVGESPGQTRRAQKTPTKRILQPSQGQNAPVSGQQLLRRGSYKKTPEERVQHSERLKKQHSLG